MILSMWCYEAIRISEECSTESKRTPPPPKVHTPFVLQNGTIFTISFDYESNTSQCKILNHTEMHKSEFERPSYSLLPPKNNHCKYQFSV